MLWQRANNQNVTYETLCSFFRNLIHALIKFQHNFDFVACQVYHWLFVWTTLWLIIFTEELLDFEEANNELSDFWSSIKGGPKEKVQLLLFTFNWWLLGWISQERHPYECPSYHFPSSPFLLSSVYIHAELWHYCSLEPTVNFFSF